MNSQAKYLINKYGSALNYKLVSRRIVIHVQSQGVACRIVQIFIVCFQRQKWLKLVILHVFLCIAIKTSANPPPLSIMLTTSFCVHLIKQRDDTRHLKLGFSVHAIFLTTFPYLSNDFWRYLGWIMNYP